MTETKYRQLRVPYALHPFLLRDEWLYAINGLRVCLRPEQQYLVEQSLLQGCRSVEDVGRDFARAYDSAPERVTKSIAGFFEAAYPFAIARINIPVTVDVVILDPGWGGIFQYAVDLWQLLNQQYRALLVAPTRPRYGFDENLIPLMIATEDWSEEQNRWMTFVSIARCVLASTTYRVLLCNHRVVTPYLCDILQKAYSVFYGDDFHDWFLSVGHTFDDKSDCDQRDLLSELYFCGDLTLSENFAKCYYRACCLASELWCWSQRQLCSASEKAPNLADKQTVVGPMIDYDRLSQKPPSANGGPPYVLFTSSASAADLTGKGMATLVDAISRLRDIGLKVVVRDKTAVAWAAATLGERVEILESIPKAKIIELYRGALAVCRISSFDAFPLSIIEAMACGVPVIVSPLVASHIPEIRHGETAYVVPPEDVEALRAVLTDLARNADLRHSIGVACQNAVRKYGYSENLHRLTRHFKTTGLTIPDFQES